MVNTKTPGTQIGRPDSNLGHWPCCTIQLNGYEYVNRPALSFWALWGLARERPALWGPDACESYGRGRLVTCDLPTRMCLPGKIKPDAQGRETPGHHADLGVRHDQ